MPIWYEGLEERKAKLRKKMPDLKRDDQEKIIVNLGTMEKVDKHMETLEGNDFNQEDYEFVDVEEITDESNANWETFEDKEKYCEMSEGDIENWETVHGSGALTRNLQDLPDELILKVLSYSKPKVLISSGQVSKRLRRISHDNSLWQRVKLGNFPKTIVKTELLELILNRGCKSLNLSYSTGLSDDRLEFLAKLISPDVEILNLSNNDVTDHNVEILLSRCKKIKVLHLDGTLITDDLLRKIGEKLNTTLEELSLECIDDYRMENYSYSFTGLLELKNMKRLKLLNLSILENEKEDDIENLVSLMFTDQCSKCLGATLPYEESKVKFDIQGIGLCDPFTVTTCLHQFFHQFSPRN